MSEPVDLAARVRSARRAQRGRRALVGGGVAAVGGLLGWVLLGSPLLDVEAVEVTGLQRLADAQVRALVAVAPGTPLARVDTEAVSGRVAELAPVAGVEVVRAWPRTLRVEVRERRAAAGVVTPQGVRLLDAGGTAFATERALPKGVVRLQVRAPGPEDPSTRAALAVLADLPQGLRERVASVRAGSPQAVSLLLGDGREVVWGPPGRTEDKAAAALALLELPGTVYDVRSPDVVVRKEGTPAAG